MAVSDRTMTQAQIDYRQALRDLPETADPQLDENGNLTNVNVAHTTYRLTKAEQCQQKRTHLLIWLTR
jgi:hypothetical protein